MGRTRRVEEADPGLWLQKGLGKCTVVHVPLDEGLPQSSGFLRESGSQFSGAARWPVVEECFEHCALPPEWMDALWSQGWRHFGIRFFRYSMAVHEGRVAHVLPLRIDLERWAPSPSQARIARRNQDLEVTLGRPRLGREHHRLFQLHTQRFKANVPEKLEVFLGPDPGHREGANGYPCECVEVSVRRAGTLVAASYLDVGREGASSVYGFFDPAESRRSLGIATFLWEIGYARQRGCRYLYPGYAYAEPSPYDYKKRLGALEASDWRIWRPWVPPN